MKGLKVALFVVGGFLLLLTIAVVVFIKTFDLNKALPDINAAVSKSVGRPFKIEQADLKMSLKSGVVLHVNGVRLDDVDPKNPPMLTIGHAYASLKIMPLLTQRSIQPGIFSFQEIDVRIADPKTPIALRLPLVSVDVPEFSLDKPFKLKLDAVFYSSRENVHVTTDVQLDAAKGALTLSNGVLTSNLAELRLEDMRSITPVLKDVPLPTGLEGQLKVDLVALNADAKGLASLKAQAKVLGGIVRLKEIPTPLTAIDILADINEKDVVLKSVQASLGHGLIQAQGVIAEYQTKQKMDFAVQLKNLAVSDLVDLTSSPVGVKGKLAGDVKFKAAGFDPALFLKSFNGAVDVSMNDGVLERLNILKAALGKTLSILPGLAESVDTLLMSVLKEKLGGDNTIIEEGKAHMDIANENVMIPNAVLRTKSLNINASGQMSFDLNTALKVQLELDKEVSTDLTQRAKGLSYLLNSEGKLILGGKVNGKVPALAFAPDIDVKAVATNVLVDEGSKQLQKVIEKNPEVGGILDAVFGKPAASTAEDAGANLAPAEGSTTKEATIEQPVSKEEKTKKLIGNVLNSILKP